MKKAKLDVERGCAAHEKEQKDAIESSQRISGQCDDNDQHQPSSSSASPSRTDDDSNMSESACSEASKNYSSAITLAPMLQWCENGSSIPAPAAASKAKKESGSQEEEELSSAEESFVSGNPSADSEEACQHDGIALSCKDERHSSPVTPTKMRQQAEVPSSNEDSNSLLHTTAESAAYITSNSLKIAMLEKIKEMEEKHARETRALQETIAALHQEHDAAREEISKEIEEKNTREKRVLQDTIAALQEERDAARDDRSTLKRNIEDALARERDEYQLHKNSWKEKKHSLNLLLSLDSTSTTAVEGMLARERDEYQLRKSTWKEKKHSLQLLLSLDSSSATVASPAKKIKKE